MKIATFDLSITCSGIALFEDGKLIDYLAIKGKSPSKYKYPISTLHKIRHLTKEISEYVAKHKPDKVYIEEVVKSPKQSVTSTKGLMSLHFYIIEILFDLDIEFEFLSNMSWKSACGISGKTKVVKQKCIDFVNKKHQLQLTMKENDVADAIAIFEWIEQNREY